MPNIAAIDLFCGAGGLTHGLIKSKVKVVAGFDIDGACRFAYEKNNPGAKFFNRDVSQLSPEEVGALYPKRHVKLLAGCAPCQPFSTYSQGRDVQKDRKWPLLYAFSRLIRGIEPELVTMENVPDVTKHAVYHDFASELTKLGYHVWAQRVYCPDYGIPQARRRHVLLASKLGPIHLIEPIFDKDQYKTVRQAIGTLPALRAGEADDKDRLHVAAGLSKLNMERIRNSKPGGTWFDWPKELRADCHNKRTGRTYSGVYARMSWDKPSPTMTTQCYGYGSGRFGHPNQNRAISLREAAMLQTFPKGYRFLPPEEALSMSSIGQMIGNAVPVQLGRVIGRSLRNHVRVV
jgi:DNA (cytosine-5)-methyltransferase 1